MAAHGDRSTCLLQGAVYRRNGESSSPDVPAGTRGTKVKGKAIYYYSTQPSTGAHSKANAAAAAAAAAVASMK